MILSAFLLKIFLDRAVVPHVVSMITYHADNF